MKTLETRKLAMTEIHVDLETNARKTYDEKTMKGLVASIKNDGLLNPVTVRTSLEEDKTTKPYVLVAGFRRYTAMNQLNAETIDARVLDPTSNQVDAAIVNLTENLNRDNLSTYDVASACVRIRDEFKLTGEEIAKRVKGVTDDGDGISKASVNNYMRLFDDLCDPIKHAWKNRHEKATVLNLLKIVGEKDEDEQIEAWEILCGLRPETSEDESSEGEESESNGEKKAVKRPSADALKLTIKAVKDSSHSKEWKEGAIAALQFACGLRKRLPGVADKNTVVAPEEKKMARESASE